MPCQPGYIWVNQVMRSTTYLYPVLSSPVAFSLFCCCYFFYDNGVAFTFVAQKSGSEDEWPSGENRSKGGKNKGHSLCCHCLGSQEESGNDQGKRLSTAAAHNNIGQTASAKSHFYPSSIEGLLALVGIMVDSNSCKERWNKERKIRCRDPASLSSATIKRENASSHPRLFTLKCDQL